MDEINLDAVNPSNIRKVLDPQVLDNRKLRYYNRKNGNRKIAPPIADNISRFRDSLQLSVRHRNTPSSAGRRVHGSAGAGMQVFVIVAAPRY